MNKKTIKYICISILMFCCINFPALHVQAGTTEVILQKTEQQRKLAKENEQDNDSIKTGDENQTVLYLGFLVATAAVCGSWVKNIKERRENRFEE